MSLTFRAKLMSYNVHIKVLTEYFLIGIIRRRCINFYEILRTYEAKNVENIKQVV
jgi:hypothetical protein